MAVEVIRKFNIIGVNNVNFYIDNFSYFNDQVKLHLCSVMYEQRT